MLPTESSSHLKENIFTICIQRERKKDPRRIDPAAPSSRSLRAAGVGVQAASRRPDDVAVLRQHHPRNPPLREDQPGRRSERPSVRKAEAVAGSSTGGEAQEKLPPHFILATLLYSVLSVEPWI